jgi:ribosomal protein S18 acetylase RimI-like enzyme
MAELGSGWMITIIRDANQLDIPFVARAYVSAWHEAYRGMVPDRVLAALEKSDRARQWRDCRRSRDCDLIVADVNGEIAGFIAAGPGRDPLLGAEFEIYGIYVLKRFQYRGIGSRLMGAAATGLQARGAASAGLWVARDDVAALAFFRALGGAVGMARIASMPGRSFIEMAVMWDPVTDLTLWDDRLTRLDRLPRMPAGDGARLPRGAGTPVALDADPAA